jgi:arsenate reductase
MAGEGPLHPRDLADVDAEADDLHGDRLPTEALVRVVDERSGNAEPCALTPAVVPSTMVPMVEPSSRPPDPLRRVPLVVFLCVHNAGRSQMAAGWLRHLAGDRAEVLSGGSNPASDLNPAAVASMAEVGIDIASELPKPWTDEIVQAADVVVTMGCGDSCPVFPGVRYLDWDLDDPAGRTPDEVRPIRDEIERRVRALMADLGVPAHG